MVSGIPGPDTACFRLSLSDSFSFVQSVGIRRTPLSRVHVGSFSRQLVIVPLAPCTSFFQAK